MTSYLTNSKTKIAIAYGITEETLVSRIRGRLHRLNEEQEQQLGIWTGKVKLLPDQVEVIVQLLGKPESPEMLIRQTA